MPNTWRYCSACNTKLRIYQDPHIRLEVPDSHYNKHFCDEHCALVYVRKFKTPLKLLIKNHLLVGAEIDKTVKLCKSCKTDIFELHDFVWRPDDKHLRFCDSSCTSAWFERKDLIELLMTEEFPVTVKPITTYHCRKCAKPHRLTSTLGKEHKRYRKRK